MLWCKYTATTCLGFRLLSCHHLHARLIDEIFAVRNFPYARATALQCAAAFDVGKACNAASIRLILDAPSAIKVLNAQRLIATFAALPVQSAPILPRLLSRQVQSVDYRIHALDTTEDHAASLRVVCENSGSSYKFHAGLMDKVFAIIESP